MHFGLDYDKCSLSRVPEAFFDIEESFTKILEDSPIAFEEIDDLETSLKRRRELTIRPIHLAANILDPKRNGKHLLPVEQVMGNEIIGRRALYLYGPETNAGVEVMTELAQYRSGQGIFSYDHVKLTIEHLDARTWWQRNFHGSKLATIASQILSMPPASAATERSFSKYGHMHSIKRK